MKKRKRVARLLAAAGLTAAMMLGMTGCDSDTFSAFALLWAFMTGQVRVPTFEERCVTTGDGFTYYVDETDGLCIIKFPEAEEVVIPEYIDGQKVMQLGYLEEGFMAYEEYWIEGANVKELTIQHYFKNSYVRYFTNLERVTYIDYLYIFVDFLNTFNLRQQDVEMGLTIYNTLDPALDLPAVVELRKGDREVDLSGFSAITIAIPGYVTIIEKGVFDGLEGATIKTPYESKPDGWEEGWNGTCKVEWGVDLGY